MIAGVGIDIVCIPRMERILTSWGDRFKKKVFSRNEIQYSEGRKRSGQHFAGSFAVKEAFIKAVGVAYSRPVRFFDVEVVRDAYGKPRINLYGNARQTVEEMRITSIHTSISHDGEYSAAVVILEKS